MVGPSPLFCVWNAHISISLTTLPPLSLVFCTRAYIFMVSFVCLYWYFMGFFPWSIFFSLFLTHLPFPSLPFFHLFFLFFPALCSTLLGTGDAQVMSLGALIHALGFYFLFYTNDPWILISNSNCSELWAEMSYKQPISNKPQAKYLISSTKSTSHVLPVLVSQTINLVT